MYKVCIFDLDGTLTDTLDSLLFTVNRTLREMKLPVITREQCRRFVGDGPRLLMERALKADGVENLEVLEESIEIFSRIFEEGCTYHVVPYRGIPELLEHMKEQGIRLAVLSNKPHREAVHVVETIFGGQVFDRIQGQTETVLKKPDTKAALEITVNLGARPEETLLVGDSEVDIQTGKAAGIRTIGVSWGFRGRQILTEAGAGCVVDSPREILELIIKKQEVKKS